MPVVVWIVGSSGPLVHTIFVYSNDARRMQSKHKYDYITIKYTIINVYKEYGNVKKSIGVLVQHSAHKNARRLKYTASRVWTHPS